MEFIQVVALVLSKARGLRGAYISFAIIHQSSYWATTCESVDERRQDATHMNLILPIPEPYSRARNKGSVSLHRLCLLWSQAQVVNMPTRQKDDVFSTATSKCKVPPIADPDERLYV
jgi:hypothetical protein